VFRVDKTKYHFNRAFNDLGSSSFFKIHTKANKPYNILKRQIADVLDVSYPSLLCYGILKIYEDKKLYFVPMDKRYVAMNVMGIIPDIFDKIKST